MYQNNVKPHFFKQDDKLKLRVNNFNLVLYYPGLNQAAKTKESCKNALCYNSVRTGQALLQALCRDPCECSQQSNKEGATTIPITQMGQR